MKFELLRNVLIAAAGWTLLFSAQSAAQSSDPAFPTPVTSSEISGIIPARDIGDPRQTTYYFTFNGNRGDVFINIVTNNFKGEIDIFTAQGLEPRTKVTIFADDPERETGRVIYQRQPERLVLRVQGRTPNDDPATFALKFAGSFAPITGAAAGVTNEFPDILGERRGESNVSSSGAIIPRKEPVSRENRPAADPTADERAAVLEQSRPTEQEPDREDEKPAAVAEDRAAKEPEALPAKPRVIITDDFKPAEDVRREVILEIGEKNKPEVSAVVTVERVREEEPEAKTEEAPPKNEADAAPANPLANVFLRVEMKDGSSFERRMTDVSSVNVIEGKLTIVLADGVVRKIDILKVKRMTIE